ncbi:hypothetical protein RclHR1_28340001 [Rhizophagus clarus]|uniref:Uncharacterized protein n=1 Tax=Rhizophagus clarus TaxID=94130 RepID=A0A2Z6RJ75_9GLOM|nr:hypothetical protein RclHR1_28340001 [Rhizophagus clarus]
MELSQNKYFMEEEYLPTDNDSSSEAEESSSIVSYSVHQEGYEPPAPQHLWSKVQSKKKGKKKQKKNKNKQPVSLPRPSIPSIETMDAQIASDTAQEQGKRLIKTFGAAAEPVRYKDISRKTNIPNTLRLPTADEELIDVNMENVNDDTPMLSQPSGSSNTTLKDKKKKKVTDKSVEKIFVDTNIPDEKVNKIRDIFVYDVPSSWSHEKILAELKAWGDPISMTVKKQRKYQTLQIKICLSTFALTSFEQGIWQYSIGDISVRWFPGNWSLHQRKKREQFRLYLNDLPQESRYWSTWKRTAPSQEMFSHLPIKAIKHFETGGKASIVVFFEKYEDVEICRRTRFNFNHNDVDYSLPWCLAPLTASQTKKSKDSFGSIKKSKSKDSFKKTKNSSSSKTHLANSKPSKKDKTKTSEKSKDKKKKKSLGKKTDDKMDIVKLLLLQFPLIGNWDFGPTGHPILMGLDAA